MGFERTSEPGYGLPNDMIIKVRIRMIKGEYTFANTPLVQPIKLTTSLIGSDDLKQPTNTIFEAQQFGRI